MKSKEELLLSLKEIPPKLRFNGKDKINWLIVHTLLWFYKDWCDKEVLDLTLNGTNCMANGGINMMTVLHYACIATKCYNNS